MSSSTTSPIIVALDYKNQRDALDFVAKCDPTLCRLKVGKELFTHAGPALVRSLVSMGYDVFLDLKFHDIPNTVAAACRAAADLGVWMINVHASGGQKMMEQARLALEPLGRDRPHLIAVTVLTSMSQSDLTSLGIHDTLEQHVLRLATLTQQSGLDGVVCSAQEAPILRSTFGHDYLLVTPGIRLAAATEDDQVRIVTPEKAMKDGASYLVIGRPITQSAEPIATLKSIQSTLRRS